MSDSEPSEQDLPQNVYDKIKHLLIELHQVEALVDVFQETKENEQIQNAVVKLDQLSIFLEQLSDVEEAQTVQNAPLLMKLHAGIESMIKQILQVTNNINKTTTKPRANSNTNPNSRIVTHKIRDSLENEITAQNYKEFNEQLLQGYLKKQGEKGVKLWKVRWFRQIKGSLHYFASENSNISNGSIDISKIQSVHFPTTKNIQSCEFQITTPNRIYRLQALSVSELQYWKNGIEYWRNKYPFTSSTKTNNDKLKPKESPKTTPVTTPKISKKADDSSVKNQPKSKIDTNIIGDDDSGDDLEDQEFNSHQPQTLYDALELIRKQQQEIRGYKEKIQQLEDQEGLTGPEKLIELRKENNQLREELDLKDSLLNEFEQNTYTLRKETQLQKKLSGVDQDQYVTRLLHEIKQMENKLRATEDREINYKKSQKKLMDKTKQLESKLQSTSESLQQLRYVVINL